VLGIVAILPGMTHVRTLVQGTWEIYVEKVDSSRVYVKITNSELNALSVGAGGGFAQIGLQKFKGTDDGFSYLMNINDTDTTKVYYDFVRGNIVLAQKLAEKIATKKTVMGTAVIQKIDAFKRISKGRSSTFLFGLPIVLNASTSKSKIQSFSTTDMYLDDTRVNAQFGIFDQTSTAKAFSSHTTKTRGFYGARYKSFGLKDGKMREMGEMGQFTWIDQDDSTSMRSYKNNLDQIISETGLDAVSMRMPLNETQDCLTVVKNETTVAAKKMLAALDKMAQNFKDDVEYTKAYAELGQYALTNQITLGMALNLAGEGAEVVFAREGTLYSSRFHGIITNFTLTGLGSP